MRVIPKPLGTLCHSIPRKIPPKGLVPRPAAPVPSPSLPARLHTHKICGSLPVAAAAGVTLAVLAGRKPGERPPPQGGGKWEQWNHQQWQSTSVYARARVCGGVGRKAGWTP